MIILYTCMTTSIPIFFTQIFQTIAFHVSSLQVQIIYTQTSVIRNYVHQHCWTKDTLQWFFGVGCVRGSGLNSLFQTVSFEIPPRSNLINCGGVKYQSEPHAAVLNVSLHPVHLPPGSPDMEKPVMWWGYFCNLSSPRPVRYPVCWSLQSCVGAGTSWAEEGGACLCDHQDVPHKKKSLDLCVCVLNLSSKVSVQRNMDRRGYGVNTVSKTWPHTSVCVQVAPVSIGSANWT